MTHQPDDAALAARAKLGDVSAFEVLLRMYEELAFRTAWLVTGSSAEAQDAVQDAFLKAHRSIGRFRDGLPFRPWLLQIVANEARNRRRAAGRRAHHEGRVALELPEPSAVDSPESHVLATETRTRLAAGSAGSHGRTRSPSSAGTSSTCRSMRWPPRSGYGLARRR